MKKLILFISCFLLFKTAFSGIEEQLLEDNVECFIDIDKGIIRDLKNKGIIDLNTKPIIDYTNYRDSDKEHYDSFQTWWKHDKIYFLPYKNLKDYSFSSTKKRQLIHKGSLWLYFEVIFNNNKTLIFTCFIPNWPGFNNVPNNCSDNLKGLLFFPATPKETKSQGTGCLVTSFNSLPIIIKKSNEIIGRYVTPSPCWVNLCQNILSFYCIYGIISINLQTMVPSLTNIVSSVQNTKSGKKIKHTKFQSSLFNDTKDILSKFYIFRPSTSTNK